MEPNKIYPGDCLERMSMWLDNSIDKIITDPPYALGSEIIINDNGKPDYKRAQDFMNKWEMPTGEFWEDWFEEAMRILKHGGHLVMFGMDRQQFMFEYYAKLCGFMQCQSLYWYYTSNMPKGTDLSREIDRWSGVKIKKHEKHVPVTPLAIEYKDYRYGVAPLKQTCETIMVFQKPYLDSCPGDILSGGKRATCGAVNIGECYVPIDKSKERDKRATENLNNISRGKNDNSTVKFYKSNDREDMPIYNEAGRYPAQTFIDSGAGEILDGQSGIVTSGTDKGGPRDKSKITVDLLSGCNYRPPHGGDSGGCSRILHVCDYDEGDFDIMNYFSKVSPGEREDCDHPTMKPKKLITWLVRLFKTPGCVILDPFAGSGTLGESCINLGVDYILIEKKKEYFEFACERIKGVHGPLFKEKT